MTTDPAVPGLPPAEPKSSAASGAWLGSQSVFDARDDRRLGRAMGASVGIHGALLALLIVALTVAPAQIAQILPDLQVVYLRESGPGGGGGGSPTPAPPKKLEVPKHEAPAPPTPVPDPVVPPTPVLIAPIETSSATVLQATGTNLMVLDPYGGAGRGRGLGPGTGDGVGPGKGSGFGDGAAGPGAGIKEPTVLYEEKPKYTSDAMRAKIQGIAQVEAVVDERGLVSEVRLFKSLDKVFGLDSEALKAARLWRFRPATNFGQPVKFRVIIELEFRLH